MNAHAENRVENNKNSDPGRAAEPLIRMLTEGLPRLIAERVEPVATRQTPITIVTPIVPDKQNVSDKKLLEEYLAAIGKAIRTNAEIDFFAYPQLHYCTFFIIPANHPSPSGTARDLLVFEANIDGDVEAFIKVLVEKNLSFVDSVYRHCEGYPKSSTQSAVVQYLLSNNRRANAFYVAHPGLTRELIYRQRDIREQIQKYLGAAPTHLASRRLDDIREDIVRNLNAVTPAAQRPFLVRHGVSILIALAAVAALFVLSNIVAVLVLAGIFLALLHSRESRDKQDDPPWQDEGHIKEIQKVEDRQLQNHLTSVTEIKPGWFRLATLYVVLAGVNLVARLMANKGDLSGIVTIHFARWVILRGEKGGASRLLFLSNYDGSWENYLGEFIDHASVGLTAIWSNTQLGKDRGFPDTRWLFLKGGSRDARRFKNFARNSQLVELLWFSAYPDLSVKNVDKNRTIHEGLSAVDNTLAWLGLL